MVVLPGGDEDVRRLDVAVDEAEAVRRVERIRDLPEQAHRPFVPDVLRRLDERPQVVALDVFHREEDHVVLLARRIDRDDVRVLEARRELGLEQEPAPEAVVLRELGREHLDRRPAAQVDILGEVDRAHRPVPEEPLEAEARERRADADLDAHRAVMAFCRSHTQRAPCLPDAHVHRLLPRNEHKEGRVCRHSGVPA
jgi:hypothetical protein